MNFKQDNKITKKYQIVPIVLSGGAGARLWPLSRVKFPKQFLELSEGGSLFNQSIGRVAGLTDIDIDIKEIIVVANEDHRFLVTERLNETQLTQVRIILEPAQRNTAPAVNLAALEATKDGANPILVIVPADQVIEDDAAFAIAVKKTIRLASDGAIAILGIKPDSPETGFGYIKSSKISDLQDVNKVTNFIEKPNLETAVSFLAADGYYWNSGIFIMRAQTWLTMLAHYREDIFECTHKAWTARTIDKYFIRPDKELFKQSPSESIDCAVMEECVDSDFPVKMVPLDAGWSDLGTWAAVSKYKNKNQDSSCNVVDGDVFLQSTKNTFVYSSTRLVCVMGVSDLIVVETQDAVLVASTNATKNIKSFLEMDELQGRQELRDHRKVYRPWGWYDCIDKGSNFKVKRIQVKPGGKLSLQKHMHRAEHWVIVKGIAEVTCGKNVSLLAENESTYIPKGEIHRLANPGIEMLEIIEVQTGSYLEEDDIIRIDDIYFRIN